MLEVKLLGSGPRGGRSVKMAAVRGPNAGDALGQLAMLQNLSPAALPALPFLLDPAAAAPLPRIVLDPVPGAAATAAAAAAAAAAQDDDGPSLLRSLFSAALARFTLNAEQAVVLRQVADWFELRGHPPVGTADDGTDAAAAPPPPVVLVHGVFGSGKSKLLVAVLWMLQRLLPATRVDGGAGRPGRTPRVLMAALTNVAVDNVIGALLRENDEEEGGGGGGGGVAAGSVLRVGSLRRIAPAVLPHSTHGRLSDDDEKSARRELSQELQGASGAERLALRAALADLDSGRLRARARAVASASVVGATCAACSLPAMADQRFDLLLLDECSQLTEPAALAPSRGCGCDRLLAVGDPKQLPPTLLAPPRAAVAAAAAAAGGAARRRGGGPSLELTLFERLANCGVRPVMLRAQYRCPPLLSSSLPASSTEASSGMASATPPPPRARRCSPACRPSASAKCEAPSASRSAMEARSPTVPRRRARCGCSAPCAAAASSRRRWASSACTVRRRRW